MKTCPKCGSRMDRGEACLRCLLDTGLGHEGQTKAERIFRIALSYDASERGAFVAQAAGEDAALREELEMLLEGYAEAGGDEAAATLGGTARSQWAAVRREEPGTVIDHFRLVQIIGEGGMGSVWEAEQSDPIKRRVALKIIKLGMDTEEVVRRFERERRTLALMTHPHIAQVFEAGATPAGRPYFAMELVAGVAITTHCTAARLGVRERLALFLEVCAAVEHAHQKGVIHRDLKPSNILVADGAVKVIDFGVAKATQEEGGDGLLTREAQVLGTPAYMSPEQAESNGADIDTRTDVYSLGAVLYELLSGALPFDPKRLASTGVRDMQRILREEVPPPPSRVLRRGARKPHAAASTSAPGPVLSPLRPLSPSAPPLSRDLDWIVMKALSKERERRYPSAAALAEDVRRFLTGEAVSAVPPSLAYEFGKFVRRNKAAVAAVAGIVLALTSGLIVSLRQVQRTNEALAETEAARTEATHTVADMYTRSGLMASESDVPTRAALWFANAAIIAEKDRERAATNRLRAATWSATFPAVSAFETGYGWISALSWHPGHAALMVHGTGFPKSRRLPTDLQDPPSAQIWTIAKEERWRPDLTLEAAAWSPSGEWLAIKLPGSVLAVLEYPSGKELARFPETPGSSLQWSPDARWILCENQLLDWRASAAAPVSLPGLRGRFSRDGGLLLVQTQSSTGICEVAGPGRFLHEPAPSDPTDTAQFLAGGDRYVVRSATGELQVRDSASGSVLAAYAGGESNIGGFSTVATSPDGRYVARQNLPVLDLQAKTSLSLPRHVEGPFSALSFSPDSKRLASGGYDNRVELWSVTTGEFLGMVGHHHTYIVSVAFSADGRYLASGEAGLIRVWDTQPPLHVRRIRANEFASRCAVSPDGRFIAASGYTNRAYATTRTRLHRLPDGEPAGPEIDPGGAIMDVVFSPDASWLAIAVCTTADRGNATYVSGGGTGNVQFWNPHTGQRLGDPVPTPTEPRGLCLHPTEPCLGVCCAADGLEISTNTRAIRLLFKNDKVQPQYANLHNGRCAYSPDGRIFATWGTFEYTHLRDRAAGRDLFEPYQQETTVFDLAFHGDTVVLPCVASPMYVAFRSLRTGAVSAPAIPYTGWPVRAQFSEDGNLLLTGGGGKSAQIWEWRAGRLACPVLPHEKDCMAGTFVPGTPWVITGGNEGKIKFWDRRTGMMIRPPLQRSGALFSLQLTPDARTLIATGDLRGNIELFDLRPLLPEPDIDPQQLKLRAELDADAEVHPGGGLAPLTAQAWLEKWQLWRKSASAPGPGGP